MAKHQAKHAKGRRSPLGAILAALLFLVLLAAGGLALKIFVLDPHGVLDSKAAPVNNQPVSPTAEPAPTAAPTPESTPAPTPSPTPAPTPPPLYDDGTDGYMSQGVYIWNNAAFELFYGSTDAARYYAETLSSYRDKLDEGIRVYNMVIPNHSEFGLPERIRNDMGCTSQRQNLTDVYTNYTSHIEAVDIYDALLMHNDEYLYLNTDTHWAPLGAFYASQVFCQTAGVQECSLEAMEKNTVEDIAGYLAWVTGESCLYEHPDHIDLYVPPCSFTAAVSYDGESFDELESLHGDASMGYSAIIYGDTPLFRVINHDGASGRKLLVVKDSYGNALIPFLISSFDEVHVADFREFPKNLPDYCREAGITDLLFCSNVMPVNTYSQIETMNGLFD